MEGVEHDRQFSSPATGRTSAKDALVILEDERERVSGARRPKALPESVEPALAVARSSPEMEHDFVRAVEPEAPMSSAL